MKIAVSGADGFLGWHLRCRLKARTLHEVTPVGRSDFTDPTRLTHLLANVGAVVHCAGLNRSTDEALVNENLRLARTLTESLDEANRTPTIVYANSIHSGTPTPFGEGKQAAADHFAKWAATAGAIATDVRLPNLFGEHGRPHYNSVIATFCHELAAGHTPRVVDDRPLPLLHAQDAAQTLIDQCLEPTAGRVDVAGTPTLISEALRELTHLRDTYRSGEIPDVSQPLGLTLFNTLRSFLFPSVYPLRPAIHADPRGGLFDVVRSKAPEAQVFCSTTRPGFTRGEHFHLRKIERFLVVQGSARIALRRLFTNEVVSFDVTGDEPAIVDMPTMWAHSITNTGSEDLMTLFWANELLVAEDTDTYPERVDVEATLV